MQEGVRQEIRKKWQVFVCTQSANVPLMWRFQGITYDTGGADIKAGGVMAGMHRDKCGAAAVAGFFQVNNRLFAPEQ